MDNNIFALFVLGFGTIIIAIVVWQIFAVARTRMSLSRAQDLNAVSERCHNEHRQLDARLTALADDVQTLERRVAQLEPPTRP